MLQVRMPHSRPCFSMRRPLRLKSAFASGRRAAGTAGHTVSMYNLGVCYMTGSGVMRNPFKAVQFFKRAADEKYPPALFNYALCAYHGTGALLLLLLLLRLWSRGCSDMQVHRLPVCVASRRHGSEHGDCEGLLPASDRCRQRARQGSHDTDSRRSTPCGATCPHAALSVPIPCPWHPGRPPWPQCVHCEW